MKPIKFRAAFGYDVEEASNESAVSFEGQESLTVQSDAEDADINVLMDRYGITGKMPENPRVPTFGDFTGVTDYQTAMNSVMRAYDSFMELPAKVRARFDNNPQYLLAFCADDANISEAQALGLLKEKDSGSAQSGQTAAGPGTRGSAAPEGRTAAPGAREVGGGAPGSVAPGGQGAGTGSGAA